MDGELLAAAERSRRAERRTVRPLPVLEHGYPKYRVAPGPRGTILLASAGAFRRDPLGLLVRSANRYGDVVRFRFGPRPAHVVVHLVRHPDDVKRVLEGTGGNYRKQLSVLVLRSLLGQGLLTAEGAAWRRHRSLIQPLFHRRQVTAQLPMMVESCRSMIDRLEELARRGEPVDITAETTRLTLDILGRTLFGATLLGSFEELRYAVDTLLREFTRVNLPLAAFALLLKDIRLPLPLVRRIDAAISTLEGLVSRLISERRTRGGEDEDDLLSKLLAATDGSSTQPMTDLEVRDEVMTFLLAGHETTANVLAWAWYMLSKHPGVARRVTEEALDVLGGGVPDEADHVTGLRYAASVVKETMRLFPPAALLERGLLDDEVIGGQRIPGGTSVLVSPYVSHRNPAYWVNPEGFDPERFLEPMPEGQHPYAYFPFGGGPRQCIGSAFAMQEATLALAMVARKFYLDLVPGFEAQIDQSITLRPRGAVPMRVRPI